MDLNINQMLSTIYRANFGKMVTLIMRYAKLDDLAIAEDLVHDAFAAAAEKWRQDLPRDPVAWLYAVIKFKALNLKKSSSVKNAIPKDFPSAAEAQNHDESQLLTVLLNCLQPTFSPKLQLIIALRYVNGLQVKKIAALLAMDEDSVSKTVYRWKSQSKHYRWNLLEEIPVVSEPKLSMVLKIIYLMFTEGLRLSEKGQLRDALLCEDALSLTRMLISQKMKRHGTVKSLYSLMLFHLARSASRVGEQNELLELPDQDRQRWNKDLISLATSLLKESREDGIERNPYHLEASIAFLHTSSESFKQTNWDLISQLYQKLEICNPSPFTTLNRAVALYYNNQPEQAWELVSKLDSLVYFKKNHLMLSFKAKLCIGEKRYHEAIAYYEQAKLNAPTQLELRFISKKINDINDLLSTNVA